MFGREVAVKNIGLPVYSPEVTVPGWLELPGFAKNSPVSSFVRPIGIEPSSSTADLELKELLEITDTELLRLAKLCGSTVVKHQWGLYPVTSITHKKTFGPRYMGSPLVPKNYILVAEVEVVKGSNNMPIEVYEQIAAGISDYKKDSQRPRLGDLGPRQFLAGETTESFCGRHICPIWLVDIEPRFTDIS